MLHWTLLGEYYSFFVLMVLLSRYYLYDKKITKNSRRKLFINCLTLSMALIALDILCVAILRHPGSVPRWANVLLNTIYFHWAICTCSQFAYLLVHSILEHVYDKHCVRRYSTVLVVIMAVSIVLLVVNLFTGWVFTIDEAGEYHRGLLNRVYYGLLGLQILFLTICFFRNRASVGEQMLYVMRCLLPLVIVLCVLQILFPEFLLNGTICALASLVIFMAFRSYTDEQDSITGAGSRNALVDELTLRSGSGQAVQILQICVSNLADVNLHYGHAIGDGLLYEVCHYLRHFEEDGKVFRSGGNSFVLILPLNTQEKAEARLQSLLVRLQEEWIMGDISCHIRVAVAELREENLTGNPSEIMEQLEYTTLQAKKDPPLARFNDVLSKGFTRRIYLKDLVRRSIDQGRFYVVYQPIYCCHRDLFCSAEALLRLTEENGTFVSPEVFIPIAEESGMITELTGVVLDSVCRMLSTRRLPGLESVTINLSTRQLMDPNLTERIQDNLQRYDVPASRLRVEITEQFILRDAEFAKHQMEALERMGLQIYMDDFGTGYSNLSSVLYYPFSFVKLDRSLVEPVVHNEKAAIMVRALMGLFRNLNKRVIMEGVETREQAEFLKGIGVDMIQGYYYARPLPEEQLLPYFENENPPMPEGV